MIDDQLPPANPYVSRLSEGEKSTRMWAMLCHLSALLGLVLFIPFASILGPLIVWQIKKNELPAIDPHGKEALNFQITMAIFLAIGAAVAFVLSFVLVGFLLYPVLALVWIAAIILTIIAGIKANDGHFYRYPMTIRFFD